MISAVARAQATPGSAFVSANIGYYHTAVTVKGEGMENFNRYTVGASGGYNLTKYVGVMGDFNYQPMQNRDIQNLYTLSYSGGARVYAPAYELAIPYAVVTVGSARLTSTAAATNTSYNGVAIGMGGGALVHVGNNWGFNPEIRYQYSKFNNTGAGDLQPNTILMTAGVFYEFGGAKKVSAKKAFKK